MEIDNNKEENENIENNKIESAKKINEEKDFLNVYFIENHISDNEVKIKIIETKFAKEIQIILKDTFIKGESEYSYSIYKFQFFPLETLENDNVIIILIDLEKNIQFYSRIKIKENYKHIFLYDIKFMPFSNNNLFLENPPESYNLSHQEQFEFYINYLRKQKFLQTSQENEDLIRSIHKLLNIEGQKYEFSFYLNIMSECFNSSIIKEHLEIFKPEKIINVDEVKLEKKQINLLKIFFNKIEENKSSKFLDNIGKEGDKCRINYYAIDLYFNYLFNKEHFIELLDNNEIQNDIYNSLIYYNNLFKGIKLTKEQFKILINKCSNYTNLINVLFYTDDILDLLQIFKNNFQKIASLFIDDEIKNKSKKNNLIINIESIKAPKNIDNLKEISELYIELINLQIKKSKILFLLFSDKLCESYISFFEYTNINNLFYIKNILDALKKNKNAIKLKNKYLEKIIHDTGLELAKKNY